MSPFVFLCDNEDLLDLNEREYVKFIVQYLDRTLAKMDYTIDDVKAWVANFVKRPIREDMWEKVKKNIVKIEHPLTIDIDN